MQIAERGLNCEMNKNIQEGAVFFVFFYKSDEHDLFPIVSY
jgi:hypothetical protein